MYNCLSSNPGRYAVCFLPARKEPAAPRAPESERGKREEYTAQQASHTAARSHVGIEDHSIELTSKP